MPNDRSADVLGIKPLAEAGKEGAVRLLDGVGAILSRICLPAAEEYGLYLRDRVAHFREKNIAAIVTGANEKLASQGVPLEAHASPRVVHSILEAGSWIADSEIQDMWAGLLASSCTQNGDDDSNLLFTNLLSGLTGLQVGILKYACEHAPKCAVGELVWPNPLIVTVEDLTNLTGERDLQRLDRELDYLRGLTLLQDGGLHLDFGEPVTLAVLTPTSLALHLYVRCQGARVSPVTYFHLTPVEPSTTSSSNPNGTEPPRVTDAGPVNDEARSPDSTLPLDSQ